MKNIHMSMGKLFVGISLLLIISGTVVAGTNVVRLDNDNVPAAVELIEGTDPLEADTDSDGLKDGEEVNEYGTNPTIADSDDDGLKDGEEISEYETNPLAADTDNDGLEDAEEINEYDTDPLVVDTDNDGLEDGEEANEYDTDPLAADTDSDGLEDGEEINEYGTNPLAADTDDDGLEDYEELNEHDTDPTVADTDDDGIEDGEELNQYETDPTVPDTDDDGLVDGEEINEHGTDPTSSDTDNDGLEDSKEVYEYNTDPTAADTDRDGLTDDEELNKYDTDPTAADTDGDGLEDNEELNKYDTDPTVADTDGDGLEDGWEVDQETPTGVNLPDADPLKKDLYVQSNAVEGADDGNNAFWSDVADHWEDMPVENPDGSSGIQLHVHSGGSVGSSDTFDGNNFQTLGRTYYEDELGDRAGVYHQTLFIEFETNDYDGYGQAPGEFTIVDDTASQTTKKNMVVHELLHNVMGSLDSEEACESDPIHYCDGGWLESIVHENEDEYLPEPLAEEIEENGFED